MIGRQGQTARALRTLLKIVGAKNNARVNLKINEPEGGRGPRPSSSASTTTYSDSEDNAAMASDDDMGDVDTSAVDLNI